MTSAAAVIMRLLGVGFTYEQARALAHSGPNTVFMVPLEVAP